MSAADDCAGAEDVLLRGEGDPELTARALRHQRICPRCLARRAGLQAVSEVVLGVDTRLDDLQRARIGAALEQRLRSRPTPDRRAWWLLAPAVAAAVAVALLVLARRDPPRPIQALAPQQPALLRPYQAEGPAAQATVGGSFDRLEVPAGTRIRARLGASTRLTLVGPAEVRVTRASERRTVLVLPVGTLLADYDHAGGGTLVIESPGLITEVVGTRLAVEVRGAASRVSVSHGRVSVRASEGGPPVLVSDGQSWASDRPGVAPMAAATSRLLDEHGRDVEVVPPATPPRRPSSSSISPSSRSSSSTRPSPRRRLAAVEQPAPAQEPPSVPAPAESAALLPEVAAAPAAPSPAAPPVESPRPVEPAPAIAAPPAAAPPPLQAADLYRQAEAAMARGDRAAATRRLDDLVARFPSDPLADTARYELVERSLAAGDRASAGRRLDELLRSGHEPALLEAAHALRCRVYLEDDQSGQARSCYRSFRAAHPGSARDGAALIALIQLAGQAGDCPEVRRLADEHRRRHAAVPPVITSTERACAGR